MSIEAMKLALDALESRCGTNADERLSGGAIPALRTAIQQAEAQQPATGEPLTDTFVQTVPDKCDRILWRGRYLHLPIPNPAPGLPDDAKRLNWLDDTNKRFRMGWEVGQAPAGNVSIRTIITGGKSIRDAIDAAMLAASPAQKAV